MNSPGQTPPFGLSQQTDQTVPSFQPPIVTLMAEEKKADTDAPEGEAIAPKLPDGVLPFFVSDSHATKLGMKTGEGIVDLVPSKAFNKEEAIKEVQELGFMSPFDPALKQITEVSLPELGG